MLKKILKQKKIIKNHTKNLIFNNKPELDLVAILDFSVVKHKNKHVGGTLVNKCIPQYDYRSSAVKVLMHDNSYVDIY